eukprot:g2506.t1
MAMGAPYPSKVNITRLLASSVDHRQDAAGSSPPGEQPPFSALTPTSSGDTSPSLSRKLGGQLAVRFLSRSGLSHQTLRMIWAVCDHDDTGELDASQFELAMKLIAYVQHFANPMNGNQFYHPNAPIIPSFLLQNANRNNTINDASQSSHARTFQKIVNLRKYIMSLHAQLQRSQTQSGTAPAIPSLSWLQLVPKIQLLSGTTSPANNNAITPPTGGGSSPSSLTGEFYMLRQYLQNEFVFFNQNPTLCASMIQFFEQVVCNAPFVAMNTNHAAQQRYLQIIQGMRHYIHQYQQQMWSGNTPANTGFTTEMGATGTKPIETVIKTIETGATGTKTTETGTTETGTIETGTTGTKTIETGATGTKTIETSSMETVTNVSNLQEPETIITKNAESDEDNEWGEFEDATPVEKENNDYGRDDEDFGDFQQNDSNSTLPTSVINNVQESLERKNEPVERKNESVEKKDQRRSRMNSASIINQLFAMTSSSNSSENQSSKLDERQQSTEKPKLEETQQLEFSPPSSSSIVE